MNNSGIMLILIFIMEFEKGSGSYQIKWMSYSAGDNIRHQSRSGWYNSNSFHSFHLRHLSRHFVFVQLHQLFSEKAVYWIKQSWKRHISYHTDFQSCEKPRNTLYFIYLFAGVRYTFILVEANYFEPCFYHNYWIWQ